ncbi:MAG TPA: DOMON domain-containing protein [Methanofastidiosum sp.]|nr:DOMON domain-containing protein [Methanofastidiosum sp.]
MRRIAFFGIALIAILLVSGCATETPIDEPKSTEEPKTTEPPAETPVEDPELPAQTNLWKADGIITQNEYKNSREFGSGRFTVYWSNDEEYIYMALKGQTSGWVSIGFEPTIAMRDADMIFGFVSEGTPTALDQYSTGDFGPHPSDEQLGGTNDLIEISGSEASGYTIIEFKRKLNTGDKYDKAFTKGQNITIIWGLGPSDSINALHTLRGGGSIKLD